MIFPVSPWHYQVCDAIAVNDVARAREICDAAMASGVAFREDHPIDRAVRLLVASQTDNRAELEEVEASLDRHADLPILEEMANDGRVAAFFLAGLMRLADDHARAATHFEAALQSRPGFIPARVELECIRRGVDRQLLFGALGEDVPRADWRYLLAASELGLESPVEPVETKAVICMRGICTPHTAAMVRLYGWLNPGVTIILATWEHTPPEILGSLMGLANVVVIDEPEKPGSQNKNRQMMLARAALTLAIGHCEHVLMVRTDIALFAPNIASSLTALHSAYPVADAQMQGRLVISDLFTRRFREYHLSDILCFGTFGDVVLYWTAPMEEVDHDVGTETYLGWHLMIRTLSHPGDEDHARQYRRLLRECVIVRDLDWFEGFWLRHPKLLSSANLRFGDTCVSQRDWEQLYFATDPHRRNLVNADVLTRELLNSL
jgi:hypothetical protein